MTACQQKPRWLRIAHQLILASSVLIAGAASAEVDVLVSDSGEITVAGRSGRDFFFGTTEMDGNQMSMPLNAWGRGTRGAGNGTGGAVINGAGNGTGRADVILNWGEALLSISCSEVVVVVLRRANNGQMVLEDLDVVGIANICQ